MSRGRRRAPRPARDRVPATERARRGKSLWLVMIAAIAVVAASAGVAIERHQTDQSRASAFTPLATRPGTYLGVYQADSPDSYAGLTAFTRSTGVQPNLVSYYSGWGEPFRSGFAAAAARHGAVPLVQLEPTNISLAAIAAGRYDSYLRRYATAVRSYDRPVILSFGHEMNAWWYSWGYRYADPASFTAAWRHIVTLFRAAGAGNVTWMWTVNVIDAVGHIRDPAPWWPGRSYVNWIGLDGYYKQAGTFAPLFGPTIKAVRALAHDPVLVAETGVAPGAGQAREDKQPIRRRAGVRAAGLRVVRCRRGRGLAAGQPGGNRCFPPRRHGLPEQAVMSTARSRLAVVAAVLIAAAAVAIVVSRLGSSPAAPRRVTASLPPVAASYLGVYENGAPPGYQPVTQFAQAAGRQPELVGYFSGWPQRFAGSFARKVRAHGATPLIQIDPTFASVAAIAAGDYDGYLRSYAASVREFGHPVVIGFGHEMNAPWYSWGYGHVAPRVFVRAWRHIVSLFRGQGADNVTWLWTINGDRSDTGPITSWWPGAQYVTWVGIDGYFYRPTDTFANVFGTTISQVRSFTGEPVLISETAVGPAAGQPAKISNLFAGMAQYQTLGLVWFDNAQNQGIYHQDWRIEASPAAEAALHRAVASALRPGSSP